MQTHSDAFAAEIFENIVAKGEIVHGEQFPLLPQCFQLYLMFKLSDLWRYFTFLPICFQSRLLQIYCMWERVKVMPVVSILGRGIVLILTLLWIFPPKFAWKRGFFYIDIKGNMSEFVHKTNFLKKFPPCFRILE